MLITTQEAIGLVPRKGVRNGASYVASLHGGERQNERLFYTFLFFYVLLDPHAPLKDFWTT